MTMYFKRRGWLRRMVAAGALVATMTFTGTILSVGPALADEQVCGYPTYDPERDGLDLQRFLEDGQGRVNDSLRRSLGWGEETCVGLRFAVEVAAPHFVPGLHPALAPFRFFDVKLPNGVKFGMWVQRAVSEANELPDQLPAVGPESPSAPVSWTGGEGLWLNSGPGHGTKLEILPEGTVVTILCQTRGPVVAAPNGATDLWDKVVTSEGRVGFASDGWINTGTNGQIAPNC